MDLSVEDHGGRVPIYDAAFAADPAGVYETLRARYGNYAPAELAPGVPVTVVLGYDAALGVLRDPATFPRDPRGWEKTRPADCPMRPVIGYRPGMQCSDGGEHARFRKATTGALDRIDAAALRRHVEQSADLLIDRFAADGEADLYARYAGQLPLLVLSRLFGCPPDLSDRLVRGITDITELVDLENAMAMVMQATLDLIALKRAQPGSDIVSWMIEDPAGLTDEELLDQIGLFMAMGSGPVQNLVANTLRLLLSDERFAGDLSSGSMPIEDALDEVLWTDPPVANYGFTYPTYDVEREGYVMPADQPVVIAYKAANTDPSKRVDRRTGNRAHLAFSAGPHTCPAKGPARVISSIAIEKLLDRLPDLDLAVPVNELQWRPGSFNRALTALPVRFTPVPVTVPASAPRPEPPRASPPAATAPPNVAAPGRRSLWGRLAAWWRA